MSRPTQSACEAGHASAAAGARRVAGCPGSVLGLRGRLRGDVSRRTSSSQHQNRTPRTPGVTRRSVTLVFLGVPFWRCEEDVLCDTSPRRLPRSARTEPEHPATRRAPAAALACPALHALCVGRDISSVLALRGRRSVTTSPHRLSPQCQSRARDIWRPTRRALRSRHWSRPPGIDRTSHHTDTHDTPHVPCSVYVWLAKHSKMVPNTVWCRKVGGSPPKKKKVENHWLW